MLLARAEAHARACGCCRVHVGAEASLDAFYRRRGYVLGPPVRPTSTGGPGKLSRSSVALLAAQLGGAALASTDCAAGDGAPADARNVATHTEAPTTTAVRSSATAPICWMVKSI